MVPEVDVEFGPEKEPLTVAPETGWKESSTTVTVATPLNLFPFRACRVTEILSTCIVIPGPGVPAVVASAVLDGFASPVALNATTL